MLYSVNNPINYNRKYTINKRHQQQIQQQQQKQQQQQQQQQTTNQVYTIQHPIDYGSTYNTNEGYLIENIDTDNQFNFNTSNLNQAEIMYQQQQLYQQQQQQKMQQNFNDSMSPMSINKTIFQQNQYQYDIGPSSNIHNNNNNNSSNIIGYQIPIEEENSYSEQINSNKQYIYSSTTYNQNSNMKTFTNEVNSSFAKYDSDV